MMTVRAFGRAVPSHRRNVLAVLHRQDDPRAVVEAGAILFGPVVDALARGDFAFAQEGLTDRLAEFYRTGFCRFQRGRDDALEDFERIIAMSGELAAAVGAIFGLVGGVER